MFIVKYNINPEGQGLLDYRDIKESIDSIIYY